MNIVTLTGRLTADPGQPAKTRGAQPKDVLDIRMAVNDPRGDKPVFVDVRCWEGTARSVAQSQRRGSKVAVSGALAMDEWTTRGGEKRSKHYINARQVEFLDPAPAAQAPSQAAGAGAGVY